VTIRGRDDLKQVRIAADQVASRLQELLAKDRPHARIEDLVV
jgi:glycyl-tRNA synthetase (class II)